MIEEIKQLLESYDRSNHEVRLGALHDEMVSGECAPVTWNDDEAPFPVTVSSNFSRLILAPLWRQASGYEPDS